MHWRVSYFDFGFVKSAISLSILMLMTVMARAETQNDLIIEQVLQHMLQSQPSLEAAALQVKRAQLDTPVVKSQLGWILNGQAGVSRDVNFTGTPSDRFDIGTGVQRKLSSGSTVGLDASYSQEESDTPFFASYPNPANTSRLDLNYRAPLSKDAGNPDYKYDLITADMGANIAAAENQKLRDQLGTQVQELFYLSALTQARIQNSQAAIDRAQRLKEFVKGNVYLGISEKKDRLQVDAQLHAREADLKDLLVSWEKQRTALNRLMGKPWRREFRPVLAQIHSGITEQSELIKNEVLKNSPDLATNQARVSIAEAYIERSRNQKKNKLDLVISVGGQNLSGDSAIGDIDQTELAGNVGIEFTRSLDRQGVEAALTQAQLDRSIALKQAQDVKMVLQYQVEGLIAEIQATELALSDALRRLDSEEKKHAEAIQRYKAGRTDISELIQFENDMRQAKLASDIKKIEMASKHTSLKLLRGSLWHNLANSPRSNEVGQQ